MKVFQKVMIGLVILIVVSFFARNMIVKGIVETGVRSMVGLKLNMGKLDINLSKTFIQIKDLKLFNPSGYPDKIMVDLPEIYIDYNLKSILAGKIHLSEIRLNLKKFFVVKNNKGELNLDTIKNLSPKEEGEKSKKPEEVSKEKKEQDLQIDLVLLKVGRVVYKDYSQGDEPKIKDYNLNLDERFENIQDPATFVGVIVFKTLAKTTIASLTNFDLKGLGSTVTDSLKSVTDTAGTVATEASQAAKDAAETLKGTAEGITNVFKKPFGK